MDMKKILIDGNLEEGFYTKQLKSFVMNGRNELVCTMKKYLYGLKQSPMMWYEKIDSYILGIRFTRRKIDHCIYFKLVSDHVICLVLYVDRMLLIGKDREIIKT